jgi:hypothetical protein
MPPGMAVIAGGMTGLAAVVFILITVAQFGVKRLRIATMVPMIVLLVFLFGVGPVFGIGPMGNTKRTINLIDMTFSARPLTKILNQISPPGGSVAVFRVRRDMEFGLSFYRNARVINYEQDGVPDQQHLLVVRESYIDQLRPILKGRTYEPLFTYPAQNLVVYEVAARQ